MAESINLRSTAFLDAACDALRQTGRQLGNQADSAREMVGQALARLEMIGEARFADLRDAQHALEAVDEEDSDWDEHDRCDEAFEAVGEFRRVAARIEEAGRQFVARSANLSERGHQLVLAAVARLEQKIDARDEYLAIRVPDADGVTGQRLAVVGNISGPPAPSGTTDAPEANSDTSRGSLPPGFGWIDIDEVVPEGFIEDPALFKKAKHDDMRRGLEILRDEIIPALKRGGFTREDAERTDQECGTEFTAEGWVHPESRLTVWKAFLDPRREADVVAVERGVDGRYNVSSGRHRLGLARKLGIKVVPVRILGHTHGT